MDKIANRSIRRVLQILGKMVDNGASSGELRSTLRSGVKRKTHWDLSKPIWERHGFSSKDELLQSWRDSKANALKEFPAPESTRPGLWQNISDFIYRVRHGHRRLNPITPPAEYIRQAYKHPIRQTKYGPYVGTRGRATTSADYTPIINAYLGRVANNYKGRGAYGRFRDLMHRHKVLSGKGGDYIEPVRDYMAAGSYKKLPDAYEVRTTLGGGDRLLDKLAESMSKATGSGRFPVEFYDAFPFVNMVSGVSDFKMPVVTVFKAQGPFATTGHVMNGPITRGYNEQVRGAINKLNEGGIPITHRNIKNTLAEAGVDNTKTTLHSGRVYPDKMAKNYAHTFDADAKPTKDYESVFTAGDPNAPVPEQNYIVEIPDSTIRARQFDVINRSGMGHILKRQTVPLLDAQGTSDLRLAKGTSFPVRSVLHSTPGDPLIDSILENALNPVYLRRLRRAKGNNLYDYDSPNPLNNIIGTNGVKYADDVDFWYTPRVGSAVGYAVHPHGLISPEAAEGIRLIPVTSEELDALHHVYDVKDILAKLPPSVLNDFKYLAASHGGTRYATRLAKRTERNVSQLRAAIKDLAEGKGINNGIGKAITRNSKFREAGINTRAEHATNDDMFKEVLGDNW